MIVTNDELFYNQSPSTIDRLTVVKEYFDYERENFAGAHEIHAQNRHHFYSFRNTTTKPNLNDLINSAQRRDGNYSNVYKTKLAGRDFYYVGKSPENPNCLKKRK